MPKYQGPNPNSGPYNVPNGRTILGGGKYERVSLQSATFTCTGSFGGVAAVSSIAGCTVSLVGGGSLVIPAASTNPLIYEVSVYQITAGSAYLYYR
jgi:hypothetical protein